MRIFVTERVQNDGAVDVNIFTERVVLKCVSCIDNRRSSVFLLLFCFLSEKGLIVLKVL